MSDLGIALTVPCPGCKMPADSACVDLETGAKVEGVHQNRVYRAYVVAEADAHNRAVELATEVERLRAERQHAERQLQVIHDRINPAFDKHGARHSLIHDVAAHLGIALREEPS